MRLYCILESYACSCEIGGDVTLYKTKDKADRELERLYKDYLDDNDVINIEYDKTYGSLKVDYGNDDYYNYRIVEREV